MVIAPPTRHRYSAKNEGEDSFSIGIQTAQPLLVSANEQLAKTDRQRHETHRTKPGDPYIFFGWSLKVPLTA